MMIKLYSTGCPKCKVLETKLNQKNIEYSICNNMNEMLSHGIKSAPTIDIDGTILNFTDAVKWVNAQ